MSNIKTNRINIGVSKIPKKYFYISVLILSLVLISFLLTGYLFKFKDEYTTSFLLDRGKFKNGTMKVNNSSTPFTNNLIPKSILNIYIESNSPDFIGNGVMNKISSDSFVIKLNEKQVTLLENRFKTDSTIKIRLNFSGLEKNIFQRIISDHKK